MAHTVVLQLLFFFPRQQSITFLELVPIVVATHLWLHAWFRLHVWFSCESVADILNSRISKSPNIMHLFEACRHNLVFSAAHTSGRDKSAADFVSRLRLEEFRRLAPHADSLPLPILPSLLWHLVPPGLIFRISLRRSGC